MITLAILNFVVDIANRWFFYALNFLASPITTLTSYLSAFTVPQTLIDVMALAYYFLPMGTILTLFGFTIIILSFKTFMSLAHVFSAGFLFSE